MTRQELLDLHGTTCNKAFSIMEAKNHDYTGGSDDPFANFRATEMLGIPAELGILTRCLDKFQRIRSFVAKGELKVKGESVDDAIEDVINYMVLLKGIVSERRVEEEVEAVEHPIGDVYGGAGKLTWNWESRTQDTDFIPTKNDFKTETQNEKA